MCDGAYNKHVVYDGQSFWNCVSFIHKKLGSTYRLFVFVWILLCLCLFGTCVWVL